MKQLNRDNHLIWQHQFNKVAASNIALDDTASISVNDDFVDIAVLANDTSTLGINASSLQITLQAVALAPATWDPLSQLLRFKRPPFFVLPGHIYTLKYKWADIAGNLSNEAIVKVGVTDRAWSWRAFPPSASCVKNVSNENTGFRQYAQLEKYYIDDNTPYVPQTLRANFAGDPYYVAPVIDYGVCPLPLANVSFYLYNANAFTSLKSIQLGSTAAPIVLDFTGNSPQPKQLSVIPQVYDQIIFTFKNLAFARTVNTGMITPVEGPENKSIALGSFATGTLTFFGKTLTSTFAGQYNLFA